VDLYLTTPQNLCQAFFQQDVHYSMENNASADADDILIFKDLPHKEQCSIF